MRQAVGTQVRKCQAATVRDRETRPWTRQMRNFDPGRDRGTRWVIAGRYLRAHTLRDCTKGECSWWMAEKRRCRKSSCWRRRIAKLDASGAKQRWSVFPEQNSEGCMPTVPEPGLDTDAGIQKGHSCWKRNGLWANPP